MSELSVEREIDKTIVSLLRDIHDQTIKIDRELEIIRKDLNYHIVRTDLLTQRIDINESYMNRMIENQFKQNESLLEGVKGANKQTSSVVIKLIVTASALMSGLAILFEFLRRQ